ncbi:FBP domain-containing protein [Amycolatopsis sp. FDAARGOS 1241]|uniref:FBP domain-containing protein n=1 Tax=Amycolatopsis sp. FDAARGOS 1241 TaxID=2778070 RepID=UPI00194FC224|nr:FBP domain-containing protein [Amycolatopsis sp. FDAARGOS 1241]QRP45796.1 FBP domain-containing protein [Amycolatopsis sp. FDAARGOS 1241]
MQPLDADQIRASFVNCSRGEAKSVTIPAGVPWAARDFLGWRDPKAPARAYLVVPYRDEIVGLSLRAAPPPSSRLRSNMCGFCATTHALSDVTLFTGRRAGKLGREGNTLGTYVCSNLSCSAYVRGELKPDVPQPKETLSIDDRVARLEDKVQRFVARILESR